MEVEEVEGDIHGKVDAARVSSLVTGAGMTAALFLLLGVGFSLQLYRRRRQLQREASSAWSTIQALSQPAAAAQELAELSARHARAVAIDALPTRIVADSEAAEAAAEAVECIICLGDLAAGDSLAQLPCGHEFHSACIRKWLSGMLEATCPLCKAPPIPVVQLVPDPASQSQLSQGLHATSAAARLPDPFAQDAHHRSRRGHRGSRTDSSAAAASAAAAAVAAAAPAAAPAAAAAATPVLPPVGEQTVSMAASSAD